MAACRNERSIRETGSMVIGLGNCMGMHVWLESLWSGIKSITLFMHVQTRLARNVSWALSTRGSVSQIVS